MESFRRELCISGRMIDLPRIIDFIETSADQVDVDPTARFDLQLAVEEACTNVIEHAYNGGGGEFELCFEAQGPDVVITLHDHGQPFDPKRVRRPDIKRPLEEREIGGLGMYLMEKLMDEVQYSFTIEGNTLVMIKRGVIPAGREADA